MNLGKIDEDRIAQLSVGEIERFFEDPVWRCIEDDIRDWYESVMMMMEEAPLQDVHENVPVAGSDVMFYKRTVSGIGRLQGEASRLRQMLSLKDLYLRDRLSLEEEKDNAIGQKEE